MRIGFDAFPMVGEQNGIGNYTRNLLNVMMEIGNQHEYWAYIPRGKRKFDGPKHLNANYSLRWVPTSRLRLRWSGRLDQLDLYHGTNFKIQTTGLHGAIITVHDLWMDRHPEYSKKIFGQRLSFYRTRRRTQLADHVIAVSHFTASEIQEVYEISAKRITVIHHGISKEFYPDNANKDSFRKWREQIRMPDRPYILFVGGANPRKNHRILFEAFAFTPFLNQNYSLVVIGNPVHQATTIYQTSRELGLGDRVICATQISIEELRTLYSHAALFVFPSRYEGFGFPVLEAMACGAPVVTSNCSALPEVAGKAAILVDPDNVEELAHAMTQVLMDSNLQKELRENGFEQTAKFTWEKAATRTLELYERIVNN